MSWTACYEDDCTIHLSDKQGSGWFPRRPRKKEVALIGRTPSPYPESQEIDESQARAQLEEEIQEDNESEDTESTNSETSEPPCRPLGHQILWKLALVAYMEGKQSGQPRTLQPTPEEVEHFRIRLALPIQYATEQSKILC
ncbi:MAG: hypothetical protein Q9177_006948, partial [Variospora cf. flavescens]